MRTTGTAGDRTAGDRAARALALLVAVVGLLAGGLGVAGCSREADTLDLRSTEDAVAKAVAGRFDQEVTAVSCPADIPRGKGKAVRCRVTLEDDLGPVRVVVTQTDDHGRLRVTLRDTVVDPQDVAAELMDRFEKQFGHPFIATCQGAGAGAEGPRIVSPGDTLTCRTQSEDGPQTVTATVVDVAGSLRFAIDDGA